MVYTLQYVKLAISIIKYVPQAYLNYQRKATTGWSIHNILLDISGGGLSLAQLVLDSSLQSMLSFSPAELSFSPAELCWAGLTVWKDDWSGLTGNPVKFFLSQIAILFDVVFIVQHYVLYRHRPEELESVVEAGYGSVGSASGKRSTGKMYGTGAGEGSDEERRGLLSSSLRGVEA